MPSLVDLLEDFNVKMHQLRWGTVLGALPRILHYQTILTAAPTYFDRLRIVNEALGPHWIFRLADAVGLDVIKANRPSWHEFYVEDIDRLHCPLDPGAPETEAYLGRKYSIMDMAFYAGMGFDGYRLALETSRHVELDTKRLRFDGCYVLDPSPELKAMLDAYDLRRFVSKEDYYAAYGATLSILFDHIAVDDYSDVVLERISAGCLILLCGAHRGCRQHVTPEEAFRAQMESLIIFSHARNVIIGTTPIEHTAATPLRVVS